MILQLLFAVAAQTGSPWQVLPVNGGGFVQGVQVAASSPNVWYTYVDVGGPYRSDDAGANWRPLHQNMNCNQRTCNADHIRSLSVDPRDPEKFVFAAGWHVDDRAAGIYISRDGGRSFQRKVKARFFGEGVDRKWAGKVLRRDPQNPDRLIAGADDDGLFLSEDAGESWKAVGGDGCSFNEIWFDLAVKGRVYAASPDAGIRQQREVALMVSDDNGRTWRKLADDPPFEMCQVQGRSELFGIFLTPRGNEIRVSRDHGATWRTLMKGLAEQPCENPPYGFCRYRALAAGPDFLLTATWGGRMFRLDVGSENWREIVIERLVLPHPEKETAYLGAVKDKGRPCTSDIMVDPRNPDHVLTTDWFNIWESFDGCRSWRIHLNGIHQLVPFAVVCDPHSPDNISYGCADMGMFNSQDGGRTYRKENGICGANSIAFSRKTPHRAYCVGGKNGIQLMISKDGGAKWRYSQYRGLPKLGQKPGQHGIYTIAVDPIDDSVLVCVSGEVTPGKGGVYRSRNGGDDWEWFSKGMEGIKEYYKPTEFSGGGPALWPEQLVFSPDGSAITYGPMTGKTFYLERQTGTWKHANVWNKGGKYTYAADPHMPGRFLLCEQGRIVELTEGGRKINWWLRGSAGLGHAIAFDPFTPGLVVASTVDGEDICVSRDGGHHWTCLDRGMEVPAGTQHGLVLDRGRLFVLTRGSGVWTRKL